MKAKIEIAALPKVLIDGSLDKLALQSVQESELQAKDSSAQKSPFNVGFTVEINDLTVPEDVRLRAGYSATADIVIQEVKDTLILPERVLYFENDAPYVWLDAANAPPQKTEITVGISDGIHIEILSGLEDGQTVLVNSPENEDLTQIEPRKKRRVRIK